MKTITFLSLTLGIFGVTAEPTDWVNVDYIVGYARSSSGAKSSTYSARSTIIDGAQVTTQKAPWSITNTGILPPSKDIHDYLSWAPYHWPNCNWCSGGDPHVDSPNSSNDSDPGNEFFNLPRKLKRVHRRAVNVPSVDVTNSAILPPTTSGAISASSSIPDPDAVEATLTSPDDPVTSTYSNVHSPTDAPNQKTSASHPPPARTSKPSCTPSPTTSMAPSATWTACPYVVRDGEVNPDVRRLSGPGAINSMSQAVVYNGVALALTQSSEYSQNVARFIETFFLNPETRMNPNMDYGQVVRGPGPNGRTGTFTGILDLRGMVKVANSIMILRALNTSDWPNSRDETMRNWISQYSSWLTTSQIGKVTASRPNNHASFYVAQKAALQLLIGDRNGATNTLLNFFQTTFGDQIARSGEQPFEATRTRPFHYRCFNLEALIVSAKIGDELMLDLWSTKSKYGATIQTALDYTMSVDPKKEDMAEIIPHVLAVAAAYGDPHGKYAAFLKRAGKYDDKAWWLYDQPEGIRRARGRQESRSISDVAGYVGFDCPDVFSDVEMVELDDGVFVTCAELRPFYLQ